MRPKTLQAVDVPVIDNRLCERWHRSNGINVVIYDEMMCAGYRGGGKDSCQVSDFVIVGAYYLNDESLSLSLFRSSFRDAFNAFPGRQRRPVDVGENRSVVSHRHRLRRLLLRAARSTGNLSSRGQDRRLDHVRHKFVAIFCRSSRKNYSQKGPGNIIVEPRTLHDTRFESRKDLQSRLKNRDAAEVFHDNNLNDFLLKAICLIKL